MRLQPGDSFERYTIETLLGEGGMGEVYRARDTRLHRRVALKVLRKTRGADADGWGTATARILREARAAAALSHPNTVAIYDVSEHDGLPFLAMELVEGTPLRAYVGADVPQSSRLRWLIDVACALAAAHRAGLVHRDVKPENVMLRTDGVIKVLDFGIACRLRVASEAAVTHPEGAITTVTGVTGPGVLVGTPAYMAPEQIRGEDLDGRADQFSWGVMAHELLSGRLPFGPGRDALGIIAAVLGELPPPLREVPEVIAVVVERALSKRREDRFASMDEIIELLEPFITGEMAPPSSRRLSGYPRISLSSGRISQCGQVDPASVAELSASRPSASRASRASRASIEPARPSAAADAAEREPRDPSQLPSPSRRPRRPRWLLGAAIVALLGAGAAAAAAAAYWAAPPPAPPTLAAPTSPAPVPTPITALPPPKTQSPQALSAYQEGLQQFRDARWHAAHAAFKRAVELDPFFAAAHLRLVQTTQYYGTVTEVREALQRAIALRGSLDERHQALLETLEPYILRDPPDRAEALRRARAAAERYPGDAELLSVQAMLHHFKSPDSNAILDLAERCTALDPRYADCWQWLSIALIRLGRSDEATDALNHCIEVSPTATDCLSQRALNHDRAGRCDRYEEDARSLLAQAQDAFVAYRELATALYARGRPLSSVRAVLEQGLQRLGRRDAEILGLDYEMRLSILAGDLRGAERIARIAEAKLGWDLSETDHLALWRVRAQLQQEMGLEKEAARTADELLGKREALLRTPHQTAIDDITVPMLRAKLGGGLLPRRAYEAERAAWLRGWERRPDVQRWALWYGAYGSPARTPEEALEALEALPAYLPLPPPPDLYFTAPVLGRVYLLAGRPAEARPHLEGAAGACNALKEPIAHTLATHHLGLVREAQGDPAGACAAYRVVLARWSDLSQSSTARAAAARVKALDCPPRPPRPPRPPPPG